MGEICLVLSTFPSPVAAAAAAETLVAERLAACVCLQEGWKSVYLWKEGLCRDTETLLLIKTTETAYVGLEKRLKELHPYEVPEILRIPVAGGWSPYLEWLVAAVNR